jgi:hypothetical protein
MPSNHGTRLDDDQGLAPAFPHSGEPDPEQPVCSLQRKVFLGTMKNDELLSKRKILKCQFVSLLETDLDQSNQAEERFDYGCPACRLATKTSIPSMRTRFWQRTPQTPHVVRSGNNQE